MKNIYKFTFLLILLGFIFTSHVQEASAEVYTFVQDGYTHTCVVTYFYSYGLFECSYDTTTTSYSYDAIKINTNTLRGRKHTYTTGGIVTYSYTISPFVYFSNLPKEAVSVTLDSKLDTYYPKPAFTQENGWMINKENEIAFNEDEDELFYELEIDKILLNRNGKNFDSKEAVIDYLKNSDFLDNLGFTKREQENSLEYFIPKLIEADDTNYYYLTVLSDKAIAQVSELTIKPAPQEIIRNYFTVYLTEVPVLSSGNFDFPDQGESEEDAFIARETGELLINDNTHVFYE